MRTSTILLSLLITACTPADDSPGGPGDTSSPEAVALQELLREHSTELTAATDSTEAMVVAWDQVLIGLQSDDFEAASSSLDDVMAQTAEVERATERLVEIEREFIELDAAPNAVAFSTIFGAGVALYGLYSSTQFWGDLNDRVNQHRNDCDDAISRFDTDPTAQQDYEQCRDAMNVEAQRAVEEIGASLVVQGLPGNPNSAIGIIVKDRVGNAIKDELKTVASNEECQRDPQASGCVVVVGQTDGGLVQVPLGPSAVVIGGGTDARIGISGQQGPVDAVRESVPIAEATPAAVAANDAGEPLPEPQNNDNTENNGNNDNNPPGNNVTGREGLFPPQPFGGLQIEYRVEGVELDSPTVQTDASSTVEQYMGSVTGSTVVVSGTITSFNTHSGTPDEGPRADMFASLSIDGSPVDRIEDESGTVTGTWTRDFRLEADASAGRIVSINIGASFTDSGEHHVVGVQGSFF